MYRLAYKKMKREHMFVPQMWNALDETVTPANVSLDRRVRQGQVWNKSWRGASTDSGTIIGYTDDDGTLIGQNIPRCYNQVQQRKKHWCVVRWDNDKTHIYPIGAHGVHALAFAHD
jgi:hypothetical protein